MLCASFAKAFSILPEWILANRSMELEFCQSHRVRVWFSGLSSDDSPINPLTLAISSAFSCTKNAPNSPSVLCAPLCEWYRCVSDLVLDFNTAKSAMG